MHNVLVKAYGGLEQLALKTAGTPLPGLGQLLVAVEATGGNYLDVL